MTHLLDTKICSANMRHPAGPARRFFQYAGGIAMSTVVLAERYAGPYNRPNPTKLLGLIAALLPDLAVLDFDSACAEQYVKLQSGLLRNGIISPVADLMFASAALVHNASPNKNARRTQRQAVIPASRAHIDQFIEREPSSLISCLVGK
jgi:tRNA(fMet)-specific endonuclease VapC